MAVRARYPCDFVLFDSWVDCSGERERKEMEFPEAAAAAAPGLLDPPSLLFANGAMPNARNTGGEAIGVPVAPLPPQQQQPNPCSIMLPPSALANFAEEQSHPPTVVSTGLRLSFEGGHRQQDIVVCSSSSACPIPSIFSEELAAHVNRQKDEIERFIHAQGEQLRRALAQTQRRHYLSFLGAAKESTARRLREKEAEAERAARMGAELEDRLARIRAELVAWQSRAMINQAKVAWLRAQLQQAAAAAAAAPAPALVGGGCGEPSRPAEDAESAFVDPERVEAARACRACRRRRSTVVLLPCRHLCLCDACDVGERAAESCPVCRCVRTASVRIFLD